MMTKQQFTNLLCNHFFGELFITEMGWNNPQYRDQILLQIDDCAYSFNPVAQRNGFSVFACQVNTVPTATMIRKIDAKLRRAANDYICIFYSDMNGAQAWAAPINTTEKREVIIIEYETTADKLQFLYEKIQNLCFELDEQTTISEVRKRITDELKVNGEKLTKDFYTGFRQEHKAFADFISGIDDHIAVKDNKSKQWYTSVMLNRLMFCYFIQKKGFLNHDEHYLRNKLREVQLEEGQDRFFGSFYRSFLLHLFHEGLNSPRHDVDFIRRYGKIPYLNGGMFDVHQLEIDYKQIDIKDEAFERLFNFFDKWRWHLDYRQTSSGKDINPDVLGYIFEQYINDRAEMGAYYTKEDITNYISKNCIIPFLVDKAGIKNIDSLTKNSGNRYIYDAVYHGYSEDWKQRIPANIAKGIDTTKPNLLVRRGDWNTATPAEYGLTSEIWRETIERFMRCDSLLNKIQNGDIKGINDFITYNLNITLFIQDILTNTSEHLLIRHFFKALQNITILDPTCGSGAFLFAAMNILEPLYDICLTRMEEFNRQNPNLFKDELDDIRLHYRSNREYFIYKTIILRNLYGVDIMVEATEIAKLRLFLKMVAVVEPDYRQPNLGLDPLPDIDFNIRCGNTLVGFATQTELDRAFSDNADMFAKLEFEERVTTQMKVVAKAFKLFKETQLSSTIDNQVLHEQKDLLRQSLSLLNELLHRQLYSTLVGNATYEEFLKDYQPFHWLAEFYQIINDQDGFDVIIGNPPYVEFTQTNKVYGKLEYETLKTFNLHALCVERSKRILDPKGNFGMILPIGAFSTQNMKPLMSFLEKNSILWTSFYHFRPARLFDGGKGASIPTTIFISQNSNSSIRYATGVKKFTPNTRYFLFNNLSYTEDRTQFRDSFSFSFPKLSNEIENSILSKVINDKALSSYRSLNYTKQSISYRTAGGLYWKIVINFNFPYTSTSNKTSYLQEDVDANVITAFLNSSLQWLLCTVSFDTLNFKDYYIFNLPLSYHLMSNANKNQLHELCDELMDNYKKNAKHKYRGQTPCYEITASLAKDIIDKIDTVLANHYSFTDEELDYILNYDVKYRMSSANDD